MAATPCRIRPSSFDLLHSASGFTLLELLTVVGIISILLGLLLSAITTVNRYSREALARAEVRMLEGAWKQYFAHYQSWPTNASITGFEAVADEGMNDLECVVTRDIARALEGQPDACEDLEFNREHIPLMEFTRFDKNGAPCNPWGSAASEPGEDNKDPPSCRFIVRFDVNGDGEVMPPDPDGDPEPVFRNVIVWTYEPHREKLIASWRK